MQLTVPYSLTYATLWQGGGSFPALRTGTNAAPSLFATHGPSKNPRESRPNVHLKCISIVDEFEIILNLIEPQH